MPKRTLYPGELVWQLHDSREAKRRRLEQPNIPTTESMITMPRSLPFSGQIIWRLDNNRYANRQQRTEQQNVVIRQSMASIQEERRRNDELEQAESQQRLSELATQRCNSLYCKH